VESISKQLAGFKTLALGAFGVSQLAGFSKAAIAAADEIKGIESRLRVASRSWQDYSATLAGVKQIAFETGTALAANAELAGRLAEPIRALGGGTEQVLATTRAINDALFISGASAGESAQAMAQFAKAMETGTLDARLLTSVLSGAPRLAKAIAEGLGVTVGELKSLAEQGALTNEQLLNAIESQQGALADQAARIPMTVGMAWTNVAEGMKQYVAGLDQSWSATERLVNGLNTVAGNLPAIGDGLVKISGLALAAFAGRSLSAANAWGAAQRQAAVASREAAAEAVRQAEAELVLQESLAARAAAELRGIAATDADIAATGAATRAAAIRAAAERATAANHDVMNARMTLTTTRAAQAAASVGMLGRAMGMATTAGRGLMAMLGGWPGMILTAITAAVMVFDHFRDKTDEAAKAAQIPVKDLIRNFQEFAAKAGPNELEEQLLALKQRAAELRNELMKPAFRDSDEGRKAVEDLAKLEEVTASATRTLKQFNDERLREKTQLGVDKLKLDAGGLIDAEMQKSLKAFETLYADFAAQAAKDNGQLKVSALEARAALEKLFSQAKTPADFTSLIGQLGKALKANPGDGNLKSTLENAIEARSQAEQKALSSLVSGLEARTKRTQDFFNQAAGMALAQFNQALALSKVAAELADDSRAVSRLDNKSRNAEVNAAVQTANLEIAALEQVAARKRQLVSESVAAAQATAAGEIAAAQKTFKERLATFTAEVEAGKKTAGWLKDYRALQEKELAEKLAGPEATRIQAEADGARQLQKIDADSARERAAIAGNLYKTIQTKANDTLAQYKTYASQVIALDKAIANNRLDTMAAIGDLQRQGMNPKQQLESLRQELDDIRTATTQALAGGQQDYALELLNRQKSLVQQMANLKGDGLDEKKLRQEGMAALEDIGAEAEAILQEQRAAAAEAAAEQLKAYQDMVQAMNGLSQQITALNENAAIKLKPEIDKASLDGAIEAVKTAFANTVIPIRVQADGLPPGYDGNTLRPDLPARAYGGPLPGRAPHDRADNVLYRGTPGEWVIQRPAVRYWGPDFLAAINAMRVPQFAYGGQLGGATLASRLTVPSVSPAPASASGDPAILDLGALGRIRVRTAADTAGDVEAVIKRAALRYGRH
jgi:tape measure domain-containing protein